MDIHCDEGVIVGSLDFRDNDQILTVFTQNGGVIKLVTGRAIKRRRSSGLSALQRGEFRYVEGRGELGRCDECHVIDPYVKLRGDLDRLQAAGDIVNAIAVSQLPGKSAPALYRLLVGYLDNLACAEFPLAFSASFFLKVLKYEGVWPPERQCPCCGTHCSQAHFSHGALFCRRHAPPGAVPFDKNEMDKMDALTHTRSFQELSKLKVEAGFKDKIKYLFDLTHNAKSA